MRSQPLLVLGSVLLLTASAPAQGTTVRAVPVFELAASADVVVIGKVLSVEKAVPTKHGARDLAELALAHVRVEENLIGAEGKSNLRVAFQRRITNSLFEQPVLVPGQQVCLFLFKETDEDFYRILEQGASGNPPTISAAIDDFAATVAAAQRAARVLRRADLALRSMDPEDRMLAAWMLTVRYRNSREGVIYMEKPVEDEERQRIFENLIPLADRDEQELWYILHDLLNEQCRVPWSYPGAGFAAEAKKWLADHAGSYELREIYNRRRVPG